MEKNFHPTEMAPSKHLNRLEIDTDREARPLGAAYQDDKAQTGTALIVNLLTLTGKLTEAYSMLVGH